MTMSELYLYFKSMAATFKVPGPGKTGQQKTYVTFNFALARQHVGIRLI